jgi:hypothetical protein
MASSPIKSTDGEITFWEDPNNLAAYEGAKASYGPSGDEDKLIEASLRCLQVAYGSQGQNAQQAAFHALRHAECASSCHISKSGPDTRAYTWNVISLAHWELRQFRQANAALGMAASWFEIAQSKLMQMRSEVSRERLAPVRAHLEDVRVTRVVTDLVYSISMPDSNTIGQLFALATRKPAVKPEKMNAALVLCGFSGSDADELVKNIFSTDGGPVTNTASDPRATRVVAIIRARFENRTQGDPVDFSYLIPNVLTEAAFRYASDQVKMAVGQVMTGPVNPVGGAVSAPAGATKPAARRTPTPTAGLQTQAPSKPSGSTLSTSFGRMSIEPREDTIMVVSPTPTATSGSVAMTDETPRSTPTAGLGMPFGNAAGAASGTTSTRSGRDSASAASGEGKRQDAAPSNMLRSRGSRSDRLENKR